MSSSISPSGHPEFRTTPDSINNPLPREVSQETRSVGVRRRAETYQRQLAFDTPLQALFFWRCCTTKHSRGGKKQKQKSIARSHDDVAKLSSVRSVVVSSAVQSIRIRSSIACTQDLIRFRLARLEVAMPHPSICIEHGVFAMLPL